MRDKAYRDAFLSRYERIPEMFPCPFCMSGLARASRYQELLNQITMAGVSVPDAQAIMVNLHIFGKHNQINASEVVKDAEEIVSKYQINEENK